ncbi:MAG: VCBS repeat-containing protein [Pseudomonadota bacterium]
MAARYTHATEDYGHAVLGDGIEARGLTVTLAEPPGACRTLLLTRDRVFEDITPRLADVTGDGAIDVIAVETPVAAGAQLSVFGLEPGGDRPVRLAATPPIGRAFRWLAPAAIADFDGDGIDDVAYVETPHIGGTLRIWSFAGGEARQIAARGGVSNHRIGQAFIPGGLRTCGRGPEIVLADAGWQRTLSARLEGGEIFLEPLPQPATVEGLREALICP